jgi:hypothetical protein
MTESCNSRIRKSWFNIVKDWKEHKNDRMYLCDSFILSADYIPAHTFEGQKRGYRRIEFSWGGPSDQLRIFRTRERTDKIEYWFEDWFDSASLDVTTDKTAREISEYYHG